MRITWGAGRCLTVGCARGFYECVRVCVCMRARLCVGDGGILYERSSVFEEKKPGNYGYGLLDIGIDNADVCRWDEYESTGE